jgi:hypothetical protein
MGDGLAVEVREGKISDFDEFLKLFKVDNDESMKDVIVDVLKDIVVDGLKDVVKDVVVDGLRGEERV